jgi:hypothetical protein
MILEDLGCIVFKSVSLMAVSAVVESSSSCDYPLASSMTIAELGFVNETMSAAGLLCHLEEVRKCSC